MNFDSAVIDLETLGTRPGSVILSAGIVCFDSTMLQSFDDLCDQGIEIQFDVEEQMARGLSTDPKTIKWWSEQSEEARQALNTQEKRNPRDLYDALKPLGEVHYFNKLKWYARGPSFDHSLFEAMLNEFNVSPPWKFWNQRCTRTICDVFGISDEARKSTMPSHMVPHCALHDAAHDAWLIQHKGEIGE